MHRAGHWSSLLCRVSRAFDVPAPRCSRSCLWPRADRRGRRLRKSATFSCSPRLQTRLDSICRARPNDSARSSRSPLPCRPIASGSPCSKRGSSRSSSRPRRPRPFPPRKRRTPLHPRNSPPTRTRIRPSPMRWAPTRTTRPSGPTRFRPNRPTKTSGSRSAVARRSMPSRSARAPAQINCPPRVGSIRNWPTRSTSAARGFAWKDGCTKSTTGPANTTS